MRTGNEPATARSALRMRLWLGVWGLLCTGAGCAAFAVTDHPVWAVICGALALAAALDMVAVIRHIRQGAHYQPGRSVPPYEPPSKD